MSLLRAIVGVVAAFQSAATPATHVSTVPVGNQIATTSTTLAIDGLPVATKIDLDAIVDHGAELIFSSSVPTCFKLCKRTYDIRVVLDFKTTVAFGRFEHQRAAQSTRVPLHHLELTKGQNHCLITIVENVDVPRDRWVSNASITGSDSPKRACAGLPTLLAPVRLGARKVSTCGQPVRLTKIGIEVPMCDFPGYVYALDSTGAMTPVGQISGKRTLGVWIIDPKVLTVDALILFILEPATTGVPGLGTMGMSVSTRKV